MLARGQCLWQHDRSHRASFEPFTLVYSHPHGSVYIDARLVLQIHRHALQTVSEFLVGYAAADGSRSVAEGYAHLSAVSLAADVRYVSLHREVVESPHSRLVGQNERQRHVKASVAVGDCLFLLDDSVVVFGSVPWRPPQRRASHHPVFHLGSLHRHTGIRHCLSLHAQRVATLVSRVDGGKFHLECRSLVFLHSYSHTVVAHRDAVVARHAAFRQVELRAQRSVFVSRHLLFIHHVSVRVAHHHGHLLAPEGASLCP